MNEDKKYKYLGHLDLKTLTPNQTFDYPVDEDDAESELRWVGSTVHGIRSIKSTLVIEAGKVYDTVPTQYHVELQEVTIQQDMHYGDISKQQEILKRVRTFFEKEHIYRKLGIKPRRAALFYGIQGVGKSHCINNIVKELLEGTSVIKFNTELDPGYLKRILRTYKRAEGVKRIILVLEDIGGGEAEPGSLARVSRSGLLSFLDGNDYSLDLPLMTFATTNYPENLLANLIDRPGRFDEVIEVLPPSISDKVKFMEKLLDRGLTLDEGNAVYKDATMAHVKEAVIRNLVYDTPLFETLAAMQKHTEKVKRAFEEEKKMGLITD